MGNYCLVSCGAPVRPTMAINYHRVLSEAFFCPPQQMICPVKTENMSRLFGRGGPSMQKCVQATILGSFVHVDHV